MALIVTARNDGTDKDGYANYDVEVRINRRILYKGRVLKHKRSDGWGALLERISWGDADMPVKAELTVSLSK